MNQSNNQNSDTQAALDADGVVAILIASGTLAKILSPHINTLLENAHAFFMKALDKGFSIRFKDFSFNTSSAGAVYTDKKKSKSTEELVIDFSSDTCSTTIADNSLSTSNIEEVVYDKQDQAADMPDNGGCLEDEIYDEDNELVDSTDYSMLED